MRHVNEPVQPVKAVKPDVDEALSAWIDGLLSKQIDERTQTAIEAWDVPRRSSSACRVRAGTVSPDSTSWTRRYTTPVDNSAVEYQPVPAPAHFTVPPMPADRRHHVGWQVMPARIVDAEVVHGIMCEAYREHDAAMDLPMSGAGESVAQVEDAMRKGGAVLAWDGAKPVGSARYRLLSDFVRIKRVSVLPSSRGRGIATAMLGYIERLALSQGRTQARLTLRMSLSQNLTLYERMGYQVVELKAHPRGQGVVGSLVKQLGHGREPAR
jgi:GNAT superfamily N-acetyltransferase